MTLRKIIGLILIVVAAISTPPLFYVDSHYAITTTLTITTTTKAGQYEGNWGWVTLALSLLIITTALLGELLILINPKPKAPQSTAIK